MQKIIFYTYKKIKALGDNAFYLSCATELIKMNLTDNVSIVHPKQLFSEQYKLNKINTFDIDKKDASSINNSIVFMPANQLICFLADIRKCKNISNIRIALYSATPYTYNYIFNQIRVKDKKGFIRYFLNKKSLLFQDFACYFPTKSYLGNTRYTPKFIPLSVIANNQNKPNRIISKAINIAWVGRIDYDKYFSFVNLCENLFKIDSNIPINLHIIGGGSINNSFDINKYKSKITFIWTSFLPPDELEKYLIRKVDICFAMGTSSIKCAQLAIPTVIPIVYNKTFNDDIYVYFFNTVKYTIGWNKESIEEAKCRTSSLQEIINDIYINRKKTKYGNKCKKMVNTNFNIESNIPAIYKDICATKLIAEELLKNRLIKKKLRYFFLFKKLFYKSFDYSDYVVFYVMLKKFKKMRLSEKIRKIGRFIFIKKMRLWKR